MVNQDGHSVAPMIQCVCACAVIVNVPVPPRAGTVTSDGSTATCTAAYTLSSRAVTFGARFVAADTNSTVDASADKTGRSARSLGATPSGLTLTSVDEAVARS